MSTKYDKYLYSSGTHYISNSGSDENKNLHGGKAGDQSGSEWSLRSWYSRPWTVVLRYPNTQARMLFAEMSCAAALNNKIGYDQYERYTYLKQLENAGWKPENISVACEEDCTAGVTANWIGVGHRLNIPALKSLDKTIRSTIMRKHFVNAGFIALTDKKYLTSGKYLLPGDVLLYENHHAAANITKGVYAVDTDARPVPVDPLSLGDRMLRNGMEGEDVKELQTYLIRLGYSCGSWGADGDFGDATEMALKAFQTANGLEVDGVAGPKTIAALNKLIDPGDAVRKVKIIGGNCYVRTAPSKTAVSIGVAKEGETFLYGGQEADNGWILIDYKNSNGWVSGLYAKLEG